MKAVLEIWANDVVKATERITFSKREAARIVGGEKRLSELIMSDKIRFSKNSSPTAWRLNASDVLRHCRHFD